MDVLFCVGNQDYGQSIYKHTDLSSLLSKLSASALARLKVNPNSVFGVRIYDVPFYFLVKPLKSFEEFAFPYRKRNISGETLYRLFHLGVLRVFWTQESLRGFLNNCENCIDGWLFKDLFSDTEVSYQAFSPIEKVLFVVKW